MKIEKVVINGVECWQDSNKNKWTTKKYTQEQAVFYSSTLIDCKDCVNCEYCQKCVGCVNCKHCRRCECCYNCEYCRNCDCYRDCEDYYN